MIKERVGNSSSPVWDEEIWVKLGLLGGDSRSTTTERSCGRRYIQFGHIWMFFSRLSGFIVLLHVFPVSLVLFLEGYLGVK